MFPLFFAAYKEHMLLLSFIKPHWPNSLSWNFFKCCPSWSPQQRSFPPLIQEQYKYKFHNIPNIEHLLPGC